MVARGIMRRNGEENGSDASEYVEVEEVVANAWRWRRSGNL